MTTRVCPPENFIAGLARDAADAGQLVVEMIPQVERQRLLHEHVRFLDGLPADSAVWTSPAQRSLTALFKPIFERAGSCVLHGCVDESESVPLGLAVKQVDLGWEIVRVSPEYAFPFWDMGPDAPRGRGVLVGCDPRVDWPLLCGLLRATYNPFVWHSPQREFPTIYRFARRRSRRDPTVWIDFNVSMTRIAIMGRPELVSELCIFALRHGQIVPPYDGLTWDPQAPIDPAPRPPLPPKRYWYSGGRIPAASAFDRYSNWMPALDAEGPGCDETTVRPDDEQRFIGPYTVYSVANAHLADGRVVPAVLGQPDGTFLHRGEVDVVAVYDGVRPWRVDTNEVEWSPVETGRTVHRGSSAFPVRLESRLPRGGLDGPKLRLTLHSDGRLVRD